VVRPETFCACIVMARGDHRDGGVPGALGGRVNVLHERSRVTPRRGQKRSSRRVCRTPPRAAEQRLTSCTHHTRELGVYTHTRIYIYIYVCEYIHCARTTHPAAISSRPFGYFIREFPFKKDSHPTCTTA